MKKGMLSAVLIVLLLSVTGFVFAQDKVQTAPTCTYCGMNLVKYAHSRMVVTYDDGSSMGTCSIRCMATELALQIDKTPVSIQVGDYGSGKLIDAEKAFWVIGGNKPGVMSKQAKWAFAEKADAEKFIAENGGTLATFDDAMKAAYESMYQDTKMIREKRKMHKMKSGDKMKGSGHMHQ